MFLEVQASKMEYESDPTLEVNKQRFQDEVRVDLPNQIKRDDLVKGQLFKFKEGDGCIVTITSSKERKGKPCDLKRGKISLKLNDIVNNDIFVFSMLSNIWLRTSSVSKRVMYDKGKLATFHQKTNPKNVIYFYVPNE